MAIGFVANHRLDDKGNHVSEIDGAGISQGLLVNVEIFDGLLKHFIVTYRGGEPICIQQTLFLPSDNVQDVLLLVPPHSARTEDESLFWRTPQLKPLR